MFADAGYFWPTAQDLDFAIVKYYYPFNGANLIKIMSTFIRLLYVGKQTALGL